MTVDTVQQVMRIVLYSLGGALVSKGYLNQEMANMLLGAVTSLGTVAWWYFWNRKRAS